jgi:hypothetical protein
LSCSKKAALLATGNETKHKYCYTEALLDVCLRRQHVKQQQRL